MSNGKGIANFEIEKTIKYSENEHLKKKFVGVFLLNHTNKFININQLLKNKQMRYGFLISNTNRSDQPGTHWWSILDIQP